MENVSKLNQVGAAISALALSMALFVAYFAPVMSASVPVLLA